MVTVRDKLEQITLRILQYVGQWESMYRFLDDTFPPAEAVLLTSKDIWKIIFGEYPDDLDQEYNIVELLFDVAKAERPLSLSTMDKVWEFSEDDVEVEADWGVEENSTELKTIPVTLVYGQPKQPEYRGYDLVDWLD